MDRLNRRWRTAETAMAPLREALSVSSPDPIVRDACIERFEYGFEVVWKAAQAYLVEVEGMAVASPKSSWRGLCEVDVLSSEETVQALAMCDDRNLTTPTYREALAQEVFARLPSHEALLRSMLDRIRARKP